MGCGKAAGPAAPMRLQLEHPQRVLPEVSPLTRTRSDHFVSFLGTKPTPDRDSSVSLVPLVQSESPWPPDIGLSPRFYSASECPGQGSAFRGSAAISS